MQKVYMSAKTWYIKFTYITSDSNCIRFQLTQTHSVTRLRRKFQVFFSNWKLQHSRLYKERTKERGARRRARTDATERAIHNIVITAPSTSYSVLKRFTAVIIYPLKGYAGDKLRSGTNIHTYNNTYLEI